LEIQPGQDSNLQRIISTNCCIHTVVPPDDGPRYDRTTDSNLQRIISANCCIHTVVPADDGPRYARTTDSNLQRIISANCCIHTVVPPDDGPRYARNMWRLTKYTKNKWCINLVFSLHDYIEMHGQQNIKRDNYLRLNRSNSRCFLYKFWSSFLLLGGSFRFV
jgi:hypothetical protein